MNASTSAKKKPNIVLILNDDMGYSDLGCYGGEIETPNLDRLAANGLRFSSFYNTARCSPSRASMLTGLHPHQTGVGILTYDSGPEGYAGNLNQRCVTIPQVLKAHGYRTYMSGKWHVASNLTQPTDTWPLQRGFDEFYGTIIGAGSFYDPNTLTRGNENVEHEAHAEGFFYTDAISDQAVEYIERHAEERPDQPFFEYVAYTAPHWPLHAHEEDIAKYEGRFDAGWDALRQARLDKLVASGLLEAHWKLTERDPTQPPWTEAEADAQFRAWTLRCMEVYAAQIDRMDQGIGRILAALEKTGQLDDTLVIFLADNGACAEDIPQDVTIDELVDKLMIARRTTRSGEPVHFGNDILRMPGPENTYQSYGTAWANLSNAPFRLYKHWIHEGGIATPLIAHWPNGIAEKGGDPPRAGLPARHHGDDPRRRRRDLPGRVRRPPDRAARRADAAAGVRKGRHRAQADVLGARGQRRGAHRPVEAGEALPARVGALRHGRRPHRAARPRGAAAGAGRRHGRAVRRLGGALRRDSAREDRRADEQPGRDAGVLGEGRIGHDRRLADVVIWQSAEPLAGRLGDPC